MGCGSSKLIKLASKESKKSGSFIKGRPRTVAVEGPDSGRGSSGCNSASDPANTVRPPHRISKMDSDPESQYGTDLEKGLVAIIKTAPKGIAYELKVNHVATDGTSIIKTHPPKALKRLEVPQHVKANYQRLMQDLQEADDRKAELMKERREQCQSRRTIRVNQNDTRKTSLDIRSYPRAMVTNVEIVHGD